MAKNFAIDVGIVVILHHLSGLLAQRCQVQVGGAGWKKEDVR